MNHEQKSESALDRVKAYLRSRKEKPIHQMGDGIHEVHLGSEYEAALTIPDLMAVVNMAEQRRMDAEGAVAWVDPKFLPSSDYPWTDARLLLEDGTKGTIPLYDRPANVAVLEARGAEGARNVSFLGSASSASDQTVDRPDILEWQKDGKQFFDATIREIVAEYAEWRDKKETKASAEDTEGQEPIAVYVAELEARIKELEAQLKKVTTPTWYCCEGDEEGAGDISDAIEHIDPLYITEVDGCAKVNSFWAFNDENYKTHIFNTKKEAVSALAVMSKEGGETP